MRILLVEDEKPLSAAIVKMLEQEHFALDAAYTGPDGLDCALSGSRAYPRRYGSLNDGAKQGARDGLKNGLRGGLKQGLKNGSLKEAQQ